MNDTYIVLGSKPWNKDIFEEDICKLPGNWIYIDQREKLDTKSVKEINPRYLFFIHWSWKVPEDIIDSYECVCFHMADVPYGRGGSPLQNLIIRGHKKTKMTALKMIKEFDAGPVYMKSDLCILGNAEEIYIRANKISVEMIKNMIKTQPIPNDQNGDPVVFHRRKPKESEINNIDSINQLYDFIRMLDAEGYPKAFLEKDGVRYEFSRVAMYHNKIIADVKITINKEKNE